MAQYVLRHAAAQPQKDALVVVGASDQQSLTYAALERAVLGLAQGFLDRGLKPGDIVLLRLGNTVDFPISYLAAIAAGLVAVPTSSMLTDREVDSMLSDLNPSLVIHAPGVALGHPTCPVLTQADLQALKHGPQADYHLDDSNRLAYIVYTSGTSGQPRAVMHAHRAIWARQMMIRDWYALTGSDRLLHAGAFNWTFTMGTGLMDPWSCGATSLILEPGTEISDIPAILAKHETTVFAAVPGVYRKILQAGVSTPMPKLRHALSAGEKLSGTIEFGWKAQTGTEIYEAFGMSECSTFISHAAHRKAEPGALGLPQTGRHVAILSEDGPVPLGETGQIAVHKDDPGLMLGYFNAPDATQARFQGHWFKTGDLGHMTPNGDIHYDGRADDMMNAGGFRVSPLEVEQALAPCAGVQHIGVTDVEVKADTRVIAAFFTADETVTEDDLERFAKSTLAGYKQPRIYQKVTALPTNANGKLDRKRLRADYEAKHNGSDQA